MDPPIVPAVQAAMRGDAAATRVVTPQGVDDYLRAVQGATVVVASRLHALILALVAGTPVVGVSYARKVTQQMADAGLAACCLELATLSEPALTELIDHVLAQPEAMRAHVAATTARFHADLGGQFDRLAALMRPAAP
jgi:polysaccharide pyruvyl transferase WcaK-like protein